MKEEKRQAAHSGKSVERLIISGAAQVNVMQAATSESKVARSERHPAHGCSPKQTGTVQRFIKQ